MFQSLFRKIQRQNCTRGGRAKNVGKLRSPRFLDNLRPLLLATALNEFTDDSTQRAFLNVFTQLIVILPGEPWAKNGWSPKEIWDGCLARSPYGVLPGHRVESFSTFYGHDALYAFLRDEALVTL